MPPYASVGGVTDTVVGEIAFRLSPKPDDSARYQGDKCNLENLSKCRRHIQNILQIWLETNLVYVHCYLVRLREKCCIIPE